MLSHSGDWKEEKGLESRARMPYYQDIPFLFQFCAVLSNSFLFDSSLSGMVHYENP